MYSRSRSSVQSKCIKVYQFLPRLHSLSFLPCRCFLSSILRPVSILILTFILLLVSILLLLFIILLLLVLLSVSTLFLYLYSCLYLSFSLYIVYLIWSSTRLDLFCKGIIEHLQKTRRAGNQVRYITYIQIPVPVSAATSAYQV